MNIKRAIQLAFDHFNSGNLEGAEQICQTIVKTQRDNVQALYFLGLIYYQRGNYDLAIKYFQKVIQIDPQNAGTYINLGNSFHKKSLRDEAISFYQKALQINPGLIDAYINLGTLFIHDHRYDEAISYCQKALHYAPDDAELYNILGSASQGKGLIDEALTYFRKALQQNPSSVTAYNNLGIILHHKGQFSEAMVYYQKALQLDPNLDATYINLGNALQEKGQFTEAIECYQKVLQLNPSSHKALNNLGNIFKDMGLLDDAESYYRRAVQFNANDVTSYQNLLLIMNYNSRYDAKTIFSEHLKFAKQFAEPLTPFILPQKNKRMPTRRLKIGYISPDFRKQSVGFFIEPVLESHNHDNFEIFCYANLPVHDEMSERMKGYADHWRNIVGMSDEKVAKLICNDGIDILVDLAGHTAFNRMLVFAYKPAPIQVTWIGYPNTTGISSVDYKIVDNYTDPPGMTDQIYTEKLLRLPECFLCYRPYKDSPEVGGLPALTNGYVTFGSFNNFAKISSQILEMWIAILKAVPNSRLIIKAKSLSDIKTRDYAIAFFTQAELGKDRIELLHWLSSTKAHLETYNLIDIGLDTFPYTGTTTTCESIWMGVPVITLAGNNHASRVGVSLLSNVGLFELIAEKQSEYIEKAVKLADDIEKLKLLRTQLRGTMLQSPLTNTNRFIMHLERCYRQMWETWCK